MAVLSANLFCNEEGSGYAGGTYAEGTATQGCDRSADIGAGMAGGVSRPSGAIRRFLRDAKYLFFDFLCRGGCRVHDKPSPEHLFPVATLVNNLLQHRLNGIGLN